MLMAWPDTCPVSFARPIITLLPLLAVSEANHLRGLSKTWWYTFMFFPALIECHPFMLFVGGRHEKKRMYVVSGCILCQERSQGSCALKFKWGHKTSRQQSRISDPDCSSWCPVFYHEAQFFFVIKHSPRLSACCCCQWKWDRVPWCLYCERSPFSERAYPSFLLSFSRRDVILIFCLPPPPTDEFLPLLVCPAG